jgi:hypothetical protein
MSRNSRRPTSRRFIPLLRARKLRRQLTPEQREYLDAVVAQKWTVVEQNVELAVAATERQIRDDAREYGFDPATILLLVQLAWFIYQALKYLELLEPTPALVREILETETIDTIEEEDQVTGS